MAELPSDWDGLHLAGYSPHESLKDYSKRLNKCFLSWGGYAYLVRGKAIPILLEVLDREMWQVDSSYCQIMSHLNWFKTKEMLVEHLPGYSFIQEKEVDYKKLYTNLAINRMKEY